MEQFNFATVNDGTFLSLALRLKEISVAKLRTATIANGIATLHEESFFTPGEFFVDTTGGTVIYDIDPSQFQPVLEMLGAHKLANKRGFFTDEMLATALRRDKVDNAVAEGAVLSIADGVHRHGFSQSDMEWAAERHASFLNK